MACLFARLSPLCVRACVRVCPCVKRQHISLTSPPVQTVLERAQSTEQGLHLKIKALDMELKQKDSQLTELRTAKTQMQEQLAAAKAQSDQASAELQDKTAQLSKAQASLAAQQAAVKPTADSVAAPVPTPQVCLTLSRGCITTVASFKD